MPSPTMGHHSRHLPQRFLNTQDQHWKTGSLPIWMKSLWDRNAYQLQKDHDLTHCIAQIDSCVYWATTIDLLEHFNLEFK